MIVEQTFENQQQNQYQKQTRMLTILNKSQKIQKLNLSILPNKKNHLGLLVQKVNLSSIEDMVSSPKKRKDSQKVSQNLSRKSSTQYSQNSPRSSPQKLKNTLLRFQTHKNAEQSRKKSLHIIQRPQQQFEIKNVRENKKLQKTNINLKILDQPVANNKNPQNKLQILNFYPNKKPLNHETPLNPLSKNQIPIVEAHENHKKLEDKTQKKQQTKTKPISISDFDQITLLGVGVYGRVSLARHKQTKMLVAIKKIEKQTLKMQDSVYLSRQIKIQSFANHPNIVQLYTFFHDQQNIYLVLQVCNQGNLFNLLQKQGGKFSEQRTKRYIRQICKAIQFLHDNQIIHRDLKLQNILVHNGVAKICDFGWAVHAPQLRQTLCGTPLYSSPEVIKKEKYDSKIDIWNIGIMTYQFLYGKFPFDINTYEDLHKIVDTEIEFPEGDSISQICKDFIRGCLQKVPKDRFQIWEVLRHPFINIEQKVRESLMMACSPYQK